jgi:hypothetical protein
MGIEAIRKANPGLVIRDAGDRAMTAYGRLHYPAPFAGFVERADDLTDIDPEGNRYVASMPELEADPAVALLRLPFGFADIQVGYCNGPNSRLNGLEWHKSAEIDIAVTDLVLLLGKREDVGSDGRYDSAKVECFYLPRGTVLELHPSTLHFAPCKVVPSGFKSIIVLPRGTNAALSDAELSAARNASGRGDIESRLLFMKNKWLVAHPERKPLVEKGAFPGIEGENVEVRL